MTNETRQSPTKTVSHPTPLASAVSGEKVTFFGIDWSGGKDRSALQCGRCVTDHCWRSRMPKRCRHCGIKFVFTASEPPPLTSSQRQGDV